MRSDTDQYAPHDTGIDRNDLPGRRNDAGFHVFGVRVRRGPLPLHYICAALTSILRNLSARAFASNDAG